MSKRSKLPENKYEFGAFLLKYWLKCIAILIVIGIIIFILQIKSFQCGDTKIEKQPLKVLDKKRG